MRIESARPLNNLRCTTRTATYKRGIGKREEAAYKGGGSGEAVAVVAAAAAVYSVYM